jgi:predicted HTH domain antitoxin
MTLEMPDLPATERFTPDELRLELACALFAQRKITSITGARLAGVDLFTFQRALGERSIEIVTQEQFDQDVKTLKQLFPS